MREEEFLELIESLLTPEAFKTYSNRLPFLKEVRNFYYQDETFFDIIAKHLISYVKEEKKQADWNELKKIILDAEKEYSTVYKPKKDFENYRII